MRIWFALFSFAAFAAITVLSEKTGKKTSDNGTPRHTVDFEHFWKIDEILEYIDELVDDFPAIASKITTRYTRENHEITAIKISTDTSGNRPAIFIDCGLRARDWSSVMVCVKLFHEFAQHYYDFEGIISQLDIIILPVANPDGYIYTGINRSWTKNRQLIVGSSCRGVNVNRNFNISWDGSVTDPCDEDYTGSYAQSEQETSAINDIFNGHNIVSYIGFQGFGGHILYPYAANAGSFPNVIEVHLLAESIASIIAVNGGPIYTIGTANNMWADDNGVLGGSSLDYALSRNVRYPYIIELPGGGEAGYDLDEEDIQDLVDQTFQGVYLLMRHMVINL